MNEKREHAVKIKEAERKSLEITQEKVRTRKFSIATEIKQGSESAEKKMRKRQQQIAMLKKGKAEKVRETSNGAKMAKWKTEQRKMRKVFKVYDRKKEVEDKLLGVEQKKLERLSEMENSMLEKVKNTQVTQEMALGKLKNAINSRPSNYENYRKILEEYRSKLKNYRTGKSMANSICFTRSDALHYPADISHISDH